LAFRIGQLFHVIHITDDVVGLDQWYVEVFGARRWMPLHYSHIEMRDASIVVVGDVPFEPMATVHRPGAERTPVGRFRAKIGPHLHSVAWYVEGAEDLHQSMVDQGVRVVADGGLPVGAPGTSGALYTHPRDTSAQLEFFPGPREGDPRLETGWDASWWATSHPLGITGLSHLTIVVGDLARATAFYTEGLGGRLVAERESDLTATKDAFVGIGTDMMVALSTPMSAGSLAGRDHARNGDILHSLTFRVGDLEVAEAHLRAHGVALAGRDDTTIVADPDSTYGAVFAFTTGGF
jgi:catechol 2,3-dioxygenase-like lactoylglutathione lyase family enzyme